MRCVAGMPLWSWIALGAAGAFAAPARAQDGLDAPPGPGLRLNGGVAVVSDYLSRGVSLSDKGPALQANLLVSHESGAYVSGWVSNTRFGASRAEVDLGVGYVREIRGTTVDVGYIRYLYPDDEIDGDAGEVFASASRAVGPITGKIGAFYTWDTPYGRAAAYPFIEAKAQVLQSPAVTLGGHLGYFGYRRGVTAPYQNYFDWNLTLSARLRGFDFSVAYADTGIGAEPGRDLAGAQVVVSVGRNF